MWRWAMVLLVGCNQVYSLDPTKQRDAAVLADRDGDGVADAEDNCVDRANPAQSDADGDLRGDVCDECPLLQRASGDADGDGVGDVCDPQPTLARECLTLVETFADPASFAAHWTAEQSDGGSTITAVAGKVAFAPALTTSTLTITERSTAGLHGSVMVLGRALDPRPRVLAIAGLEATGFYGCRLHGDLVAADGFGASIGELSSLVPDPSVGDRFLIRLDTITGTPVTVLCRVDHGASVAAQVRDSEAGSGPAGVRVNAVPAEVDAVAFVASRADADQPCSTEYR